MIVIRVELHSARTGAVKTLSCMRINRTRTGSTIKGKTPDLRAGHNDYEGKVLRAPKFNMVVREGSVHAYRSQVEPVWTLIASMLLNMGYGAPWARQRANPNNPICHKCQRDTKSGSFGHCMHVNCPKGLAETVMDRD